MSLNFPNLPDELNNLPDAELVEIMADRSSAKISAVIARNILEERKRDEQRKYDAEQLELKHRLENENISRQISANSIFANKQAKILEQQLKIMWRSTLVTAASTVIASIAAVILAYALTQTQKPLQIKLDSEQLLQLRTLSSNAETHFVQKRDKVLTSPTPSIKTKMIQPEGRAPR